MQVVLNWHAGFSCSTETTWMTFELKSWLGRAKNINFLVQLKSHKHGKYWYHNFVLVFHIQQFSQHCVLASIMTIYLQATVQALKQSWKSKFSPHLHIKRAICMLSSFFIHSYKSEIDEGYAREPWISPKNMKILMITLWTVYITYTNTHWPPK